MNSGSFGYLVKQGIKNVWLNRLMSFASVGILVACFILFGSAAMLTLNVRDVFAEIESNNEIEVYLEPEVTAADINAMKTEMSKLGGVGELRFVSKAEALEEQKEFMGEDASLLAGLEDDNPMPDLFRITLTDLAQLDELVSYCEGMQHVESISAPTNLAETLLGIRKTLLILGAFIISILLITSLVVISNTIRLTVFARRREINIMKFVGATNAFIRLPFVVEGIAIGLIAAVLAFVSMYFMYDSIELLIVDSGVEWIRSMAVQMVSFGDIWYYLAGGFALCGVLVGTVGSSVSINKYLEV